MFLRGVLLLLIVYEAKAYFTLKGKCPQDVKLQDDFKLADFFGKWHQAYYYSSDGRHKNNCSTIELLNGKDGIYLNQTRIDSGLFHRYSVGKLVIPPKLEDAAHLNVSYYFLNAPRRLMTREYNFHVLSTNYNYYASVYTCQYSPLIDKHYIYVWILSRNVILNDVSKELASKSLSRLGVNSDLLVKDEHAAEKCTPKYYQDISTEPLTFNYPVII